MRSEEYAERRAELLAETTPGPARRSGLSALSDAWLRQLWGEAAGAVEAPETAVALAAVGGYGRRELAPGSDLDLLLVYSDKSLGPTCAALADKVWYPVWDSGVRLDHAVRSVDEARRLASSDLSVLLGLLDARTVAGDPTVVARLRSAVLADWRAAARRRLPELRTAWDERLARFGDVRHDLAPDLKEGRGGLRDLSTLRAVAASWVADRPHTAVDPAARTLSDVRDALQQCTGRAGSTLQLQEQDAVAALLGLPDADVLLREVASAAATISHAGEVTWRRAMTALGPSRGVLALRGRPGRSRAPVIRLLGPGLAEHDGEAVLTAQADVTRDPVLVLRYAARAARAGLPLAPASVDRLAADGPPLPQPWPEPALACLLDLLGAGPGTVAVWEALDQAGLVTRLLPEWALVRHLPQRNALHRFTVDRHLLETVVRASGLVREVGRPDLLLLAALLHDLGKGVPDESDHSVAGAERVPPVLARMGLPAADARTVALLVRHHLLLAQAATRWDLHDPATAAVVAEAVGSPQVLELLAALTVADAQATGPAAWNSWKHGLVRDLVARVRLHLPGASPPEPPPLPPAARALIAPRRLAVLAEPCGGGAWAVTVAAPDRSGLFAAIAGVLALHRLPVRAAQIRTEEDMAVDRWVVEPEPGHEPQPEALRRDLARALRGELDLPDRLAARDRHRRPARVPPAAPVVREATHTSASATVLEVRAADQPGLLYRLGGVLTGLGLDVRDARVATLGGEVVDVFYLQDGQGRPLDPETVERVSAALVAVAG